MIPTRRMRRRLRSTYFDHLSEDVHEDIVRFAIVRSNYEELQKMPSLLLSTTTPFLFVPGKLFNSLKIVRNFPPGCTMRQITLDLNRDKFESNFVLRYLLPRLQSVHLQADGCDELNTIRAHCRAFQLRCTNVKHLHIRVCVLPQGPPSLAILLIRAIGTRLNKISLTNHSHRANWDSQLAPLANTIADTCKSLECFEFEGHYAHVLKPVYCQLGNSLKQISILVLSSVKWLDTINDIRRHCRNLASIHLNSFWITKHVAPPPSRQLQQLFMSYNNQLQSVNVTMLEINHIPQLFSACPNIRCAVNYDEYWHHNNLGLDHLRVVAPRLNRLAFSVVDMSVPAEFLARAMKRCVGLEFLSISDIQSNVSIKALFSVRMQKLSCLFLSVSEQSLSGDTLYIIARNTCNLNTFELILEHSKLPYHIALYAIAKSNPFLKRFVICESDERSLGSCILLTTCLVDFVEKARRLVEVLVELRPADDFHGGWSDKIATLLRPLQKRKLEGFVKFGHNYKL